MFAFRVAMTIINIFMILLFLVETDIKSKIAATGALFIELALVCNTILIWS